MRGTWRVDFITVDPGRYVAMALETGISFNRGPAAEPGRGLVYQEL